MFSALHWTAPMNKRPRADFMKLVHCTWKFLRAVSGDDAYERYLDHMRQHHPLKQVMTPREYYRYLAEQRSKEGRCC